MSKTKDTFALDLSGQAFARWTVLEKSKNKGPHGEIYWLCRCQCGVMREVMAGTLRNGTSRSCGCLSVERTRKHGMEGTRIYDAWAHMLTRCRNPRHKNYANYGGRGISVCERWLKFENFLADMGEMPDGLSIDRIDNDGNYEPGNCRWATVKQQNRNRRSSSLIEWDGEKLSIAELAERHGIKRKVVEARLRRGLSTEAALSPKRYNRWDRGIS